MRRCDNEAPTGPPVPLRGLVFGCEIPITTREPERLAESLRVVLRVGRSRPYDNETPNTERTRSVVVL